MEYILENLFFLLRCKFEKMVIMSNKSSTNIYVLCPIPKSFLHPQQGKTKCMLMMSMKPSTNSHIQPRSVLLGLIVKLIESSGKNVSTPPRMHFEKTKRMVMMSINSIVKFMGPVSVVKVLRRANIAIKCTCKCKK